MRCFLIVIVVCRQLDGAYKLQMGFVGVACWLGGRCSCEGGTFNSMRVAMVHTGKLPTNRAMHLNPCVGCHVRLICFKSALLAPQCHLLLKCACRILSLLWQAENVRED